MLLSAEMPVLTCPRCHARANFSHQWGVERALEGRGVVTWGVWACDACGRTILGESDPNGRPINYHPQTLPQVDFPDVPETVVADAAEAFRCVGIEAWRASAAMARRALQTAAFEKGAPDTNLVAQIDWLAEQGHITEQMKQVAHQIRLGGNLGAHPDQDGLREVGQAEARAILHFLADFFRYVYEIPANLARISGAGEQPPRQ
jgi:hypothetical protein